MNIHESRKMIDDIDVKIIELLSQRLKISDEIGREKKESKRPVEDKQREEQVLKNIRELAKKEALNPEDVERIYKLVIKASKNIQGMEVAFQGEPGAYSQEAAMGFFGPSVETGPFDTLEEVFAAVQEGTLPYGIIPVENSQVGSISRSYDLLLDSDVMVRGETQIKVSHCLIANKGATLESVKKVYSHPQALGQSQGFLKRMGYEVIPTYDTAGSVKMIKDEKILDGAAIASATAAQIYDMKILASEIEHNPNNTTRFFILSGKDSPPTGNDKTSVVFLLQHKPGTLYEVIRIFADRGINLTKIESRPTRQKPWEYHFYLDFEGHRKDANVHEALDALKEHSTFLKVLGSYPRAKPQ